MTHDEALRLLTAMGQEHVLRFWDRLDAAQRDALLAQVATLDGPSLNRMRAMLGAADAAGGPGAIEPAPVARLAGAERESARAAGEAALRRGEVGVILVAGGQGSRLGFDGPKGVFPIGPVSGAPLFYFHARKILALERRYGTRIPLYIMTSDSNDADTRAFFQTHAFFGLAPERVHFFVQGMWPAMAADGRILLDRPDHLFMSPDGHGGTVSALKRTGMLDNMAACGLRMLFFFQVDNPMVDVADPVFLGFHALQHAQISIKVCPKRDPEEKLGVVVACNGRQSMVEYTELTRDQKHAVLPSGELRFRYGSVAIHVFDFEFLRQQADIDLPLHLAHKKVPACDASGRTVTPDKPNAYKFEKFIFDLIPNATRACSLEFSRDDEFSPVKNAEGEDSPASVKRDLTRKFARWFETIGIAVPRAENGEPARPIEIDPAFANDAAELKARLPAGYRIQGEVLLKGP